MAHVTKGINVDECGHRVHHNQHDGGERIDTQAPVGRQRAGIYPAKDFNLRGVMALGQKPNKYNP
jgi:hypothetical protein